MGMRDACKAAQLGCQAQVIRPEPDSGGLSGTGFADDDDGGLLVGVAGGVGPEYL